MQLEDTGAALQFLASLGTDECFNTAPENASKDELIAHTLQKEIMQTAKPASYCGEELNNYYDVPNTKYARTCRMDSSVAFGWCY